MKLPIIVFVIAVASAVSVLFIVQSAMLSEVPTDSPIETQTMWKSNPFPGKNGEIITYVVVYDTDGDGVCEEDGDDKSGYLSAEKVEAMNLQNCS